MDEGILERNKNINRGFMKLRGWRDAVDLYVFVCKLMKSKKDIPFKVRDKIYAAANFISSNISEGYCRRSINEYLQHLNIANGSCGELYTQMFAIYKAEQITFDDRHYKTENQLLRLLAQIQSKRGKGDWDDSFVIEYLINSKTSLTHLLAGHRLHSNGRSLAGDRLQIPKKCSFFSQKVETKKWMQLDSRNRLL